MEENWDMQNRCFIVYAHLGKAEAYMHFQSIDDAHVLRFTSYEFYGFHVDIDYPIDRGGFRIEKEFWSRKRLESSPTEHPVT